MPLMLDAVLPRHRVAACIDAITGDGRLVKSALSSREGKLSRPANLAEKALMVAAQVLQACGARDREEDRVHSALQNLSLATQLGIVLKDFVGCSEGLFQAGLVFLADVDYLFALRAFRASISLRDPTSLSRKVSCHAKTHRALGNHKIALTSYKNCLCDSLRQLLFSQRSLVWTDSKLHRRHLHQSGTASQDPLFSVGVLMDCAEVYREIGVLDKAIARYTLALSLIDSEESQHALHAARINKDLGGLDLLTFFPFHVASLTALQLYTVA
eukprot:1588768-Rhodomonas_salina.2